VGLVLVMVGLCKTQKSPLSFAQGAFALIMLIYLIIARRLSP
jgi:hypothetical protein